MYVNLNTRQSFFNTQRTLLFLRYFVWSKVFNMFITVKSTSTLIIKIDKNRKNNRGI